MPLALAIKRLSHGVVRQSDQSIIKRMAIAFAYCRCMLSQMMFVAWVGSWILWGWSHKILATLFCKKMCKKNDAGVSFITWSLSQLHYCTKSRRFWISKLLKGSTPGFGFFFEAHGAVFASSSQRLYFLVFSFNGFAFLLILAYAGSAPRISKTSKNSY